MEDAKNPRFDFNGQAHHVYYLGEERKRREKDQDAFDTLQKNTFAESNSHLKIITPYG